MKRIGDEAAGIGSKQRIWHGPPENEARDPHLCAAWGCPLAGALSGGGATRHCWLHFGAGVESNDRITAWLRHRWPVVEALQVTEAWTVPQMDALALRLTDAGFADLAPTVRELRHEGYGRHGEGLTVQRDERAHPKLYMQRLRGLVSTLMQGGGQG